MYSYLICFTPGSDDVEMYGKPLEQQPTTSTAVRRANGVIFKLVIESK
jgi:hypothetical protein